MLGKLTWEAIPFHEPIVMVTSAVVAITLTAVLCLLCVAAVLALRLRNRTMQTMPVDAEGAAA